ncbi:hypothetical protein PHLGIDRAFT_436294 [Phlebiopsis gigantea 11061_1 CR5-6]|uniref:Uncharacterized protein n=1 Tax=Phlebiopsis gigantea (strain 11061_1 CR5-6) TaxID=745531 RepID=A0A0C3SDB2_PHLG1|nr:hypothetical protein PHLGIDRAFT_436294 [Phlebiopsis gigantea 11061_1 CR5-6]
MSRVYDKRPPAQNKLIKFFDGHHFIATRQGRKWKCPREGCSNAFQNAHELEIHAARGMCIADPARPVGDNQQVVSPFQELRAHANARRNALRREREEPLPSEPRRKVPNIDDSAPHTSSAAASSRNAVGLKTPGTSGSSTPATDRIRLSIPGRAANAEESDVHFVARRTHIDANDVHNMAEDYKRSVSIPDSPTTIQQDAHVLSGSITLANPLLCRQKDTSDIKSGQGSPDLNQVTLTVGSSPLDSTPLTNHPAHSEVSAFNFAGSINQGSATGASIQLRRASALVRDFRSLSVIDETPTKPAEPSASRPSASQPPDSQGISPRPSPPPPSTPQSVALRDPAVPPAEYPITPTSLRSSSSPTPTAPASSPREFHYHSLSYVTPPPPPTPQLAPELFPEPASDLAADAAPELAPERVPERVPERAPEPAPEPAPRPVPKPPPKPWETPDIPRALQAFFATFEVHEGIDFRRLAGALARYGFDDDWGLSAIAAYPACGVWEEARDELDATMPNFALSMFVRALRRRAERDAAAGMRWAGLR